MAGESQAENNRVSVRLDEKANKFLMDLSVEKAADLTLRAWQAKGSPSGKVTITLEDLLANIAPDDLGGSIDIESLKNANETGRLKFLRWFMAIGLGIVIGSGAGLLMLLISQDVRQTSDRIEAALGVFGLVVLLIGGEILWTANLVVSRRRKVLTNVSATKPWTVEQMREGLEYLRRTRGAETGFRPPAGASESGPPVGSGS